MASAGRKSTVIPRRKPAQIVSRRDAVFYMVLAVLAGALNTVFISSTIRTLLTGPVTLDLPLENVSPPRVDGSAEAVLGARYSTAEVAFAGLPSYEAGLLASSAALSGVIVLAISVLVFVLCRRLRAERPYTEGSARAVGITGIVVATAGTFEQVLDAAGRSRLVEYSGLFPANTGSGYFVLDLNPAPLVIGVVMSLFAAITQRGRRLQDDVDGLV